MPVNYLSNRELLSEIHKSKVTFCSYVDDLYSGYDFIIRDLKELTPKLVEEVRVQKCKRRGQPELTLDEVPPESVVLRLMTDAHVPMVPKKLSKAQTKAKAKTKHVVTVTGHRDAPLPLAPKPPMVKAKTSFPPFSHYILTADGPQEVCRSHWKGGLQNGVFSTDHGRISYRLAKAFILLVDRYGRKPNWRGYSYLEDMKAQALAQLSQVGLQFNESKGDNPFAFYTTTVKNCFVRIINTEKRVQTLRDDLLIRSGHAPSFSRQTDDALRGMK